MTAQVHWWMTLFHYNSSQSIKSKTSQIKLIHEMHMTWLWMRTRAMTKYPTIMPLYIYIYIKVIYWVNYGINIKHYEIIFIFGWTIPLMLIKQQKAERKIIHYSWLKNFNTVALGISLYSFLFLYFTINIWYITPAKYTLPENKARFVLFVYYVYL